MPKYRVTTDHGVYDITVDGGDESSNAGAQSDESSSSGLKIAAVRPALATAERIAAQVGTSPNIAKAGTVVGRVLGGATGLATTGTLTGAVSGAAKGGKMVSAIGSAVQRPAGAVATALESVMPYAQTLATVGGVQSVLDLAKMAPGESQRSDIGLLGMAGSKPDLEILTAAVAKGANPAQAAAQIANGDMTRFSRLMTAYMQARQVK